MPPERLITIEPYALRYTRAGAGVCLREKNGGKVAVIFIDLPAGMAYERALNGESAPRPDSPTLLCSMIDAMDCVVRMILIRECRGEIYHARITLDVRNEVMTKILELDARPSDALMIAARFKMPVKILSSVWDEMEDIAHQLSQLNSDSTDSRAPVYLVEES